jgi:SAM-dependent methyltransferase
VRLLKHAEASDATVGIRLEDEMSVFFYKVVYRLGFTPWERLETLPAAQQALAMIDREQAGRQPPYGPALDIGCGTGIWSVRLAARGWQVTGIDIVPRAIQAARKRAAEAGVDVRFIQADISAMQAAELDPGYKLLLDFGTVHGLEPTRRAAVGRLVNAVAAPDATLLMYALAPRKRGRGLLPSGADRAEIEAIYRGWKVVDEQPFDASGLPESTQRDDPRWYQLRRG